MAKQNGEKPMKAPSLYHLFYEDHESGSLVPLGQYEGRNAEQAVQAHLTEVEGDHNGQPFVIVPDRNLSRVQVEVETVQKVKLSPA